ncbi:unnamed protein product [Acanthoscelides obtectus]|uniref:Uncharacterized protein n=1 Tax=Acanthoscelides obtectus TaxID=200917 RepID=A0A9P0LH64_ACAOB|nr:unnamed protein product [Acanthoscelides obtectus]CAK1636158.1 hypothetical protein AOBTE_LOCUS9768 [Acanthoscelides obtectus]
MCVQIVVMLDNFALSHFINLQICKTCGNVLYECIMKSMY